MQHKELGMQIISIIETKVWMSSTLIKSKINFSKQEKDLEDT